MIRFINIRGKTDDARSDRLEAVTLWMRAQGWEMTDFSEEAGSAIFEREAGAPRLGWFDPTRWLPGPFSWQPAALWEAVRADPRLLLAAGMLAALLAMVVTVVVVLAVFFTAPDFPPPTPAQVLQKTEQEALETWWVVTSGRLNVREAPSTESQVVGILYKDQRVLLGTRVDASWVEIELPERGFVARKYVRAEPPKPEARQ